MNYNIPLDIHSLIVVDRSPDNYWNYFTGGVMARFVGEYYFP
jgi:hypothetical protein